MVKKSTLFKNLYKNTPLEKYRKYFCYGFEDDWFGNKQIGRQCEGLWPNEASIKALNKIERYFNDNKVSFIFINKEKPDINILFFKQDKPSKLAIVAAGGGLSSVASFVESLPVAVKLYELGFSVAVLTYSIRENAKFRSTNDDLVTAINYLKNHKNELNIIMENYIVGGFSAGGYVIATLGTNNLGYKIHNLPKPGLIFLGYPVLTMGKYTHIGTRDYLLGKEPSDNLIEEYSIEKHVSHDFPPCFIWQCKKDNQVPIQNSKQIVDEFKKHNVKYVYKTYDSKAHGWGIATRTPARYWLNQMLRFYEILYKN